MARKNRLPDGRNRRASAASFDPSSHARKAQPGRVIAVPCVCCLLVLGVALVYGQTLRHDFVNFDDAEYVTGNRQVAGGVTATAVAWSFSHFHNGNWHPLTWLSHMLDCQLYGVDRPGLHHLTAVALHACNTVLLFLVLRQMTGRLWPSAIVAALFGIHPQHVESVAWLAERKDVLSGLFFLLALAAYTGYARGPFSLLRYLLVTLLFVLGLMSKPMVVTLPFVFLLLDYWPLARAGASRWALLLEKLPWLAISAASCAVTYLAQQSSESVWHRLPLEVRLGNALVSYVAYLWQFFWPAGLAAFYPHPQSVPPDWQIACCLLLLAGISLAVAACARSRPYLTAGWFWYLGMLAPVIGLVQVGGQAMADRYMYLPQIGLSIAVTWGLKRAAADWQRAPVWRAAVLALALACLAAAAWRQAAYWKDGVTLWSHALECTSRNSWAENSFGAALAARERYDEATVHFQRAVEIDPEDEYAHSNLGIALARAGKIDDAIVQFEAVLRIKPHDELTHKNLGALYLQKGQLDKAVDHLQHVRPR